MISYTAVLLAVYSMQLVLLPSYLAQVLYPVIISYVIFVVNLLTDITVVPDVDKTVHSIPHTFVTCGDISQFVSITYSSTFRAPTAQFSPRDKIPISVVVV